MSTLHITHETKYSMMSTSVFEGVVRGLEEEKIRTKNEAQNAMHLDLSPGCCQCVRQGVRIRDLAVASPVTVARSACP